MNARIERVIAVARGRQPADLVLTHARIVNVFTGEIEHGNVAIAAGLIAGIGDYTEGKEVIDLRDRYLLPGLIDGHVHIESSMLDVGEYARAVVPRGTTAVVTDLHEIANICGLDGIQYVLERARRLPLDVFLMAPSCVPATNLETSGAELGVAEVRRLLRLRQCRGLGEVMNYPGVINGDKTVLAKIAAARGKVVDGHAPGLTGRDLQAYIAAGIQSDHESVTLEEGREKLQAGMHIMIREGSSEKNLEALLPLVTDETFRRCMFVVDDRTCTDLLTDGDIDAVVREAIGMGLEPVRAIQMATVNPAAYFRLERLGAVAPGYYANLVVSGDLAVLPIDIVFHQGRLVAKDGKSLFSPSVVRQPQLRDTVNPKPFSIEALRLRAKGKTMPVIEIIPGQIVTRKRMEQIDTVDGYIRADARRDIAKLVVVERHKRTGNIGVGLVSGFGLKRGAIGSSTAHDSHNIVVAGTNDHDIYTAIKEIQRLRGGLTTVAGGKVIASLPLPVAGLLSDKPLEEVTRQFASMEKAAVELGVRIKSPFATLSFLALPVIPELRVTDLGVVDVKEFRVI